MKYNLNTFSHDHVFEHQDLYNTCNHWINSGTPRPNDYDDVLERHKTGHWIDKFHDNYHIITLDREDMRWMKDALQVGFHTSSFSHLYDDQLLTTCRKYTVPVGNWFIRTDKVSLKYGQYGIGPYSDLEHIIKSLVSSTSKHACFNQTDQTCNIYFLPWQEIDPEKEFRVFVYNNQITAVSTQDLYNVNEWLTHMSDSGRNQILDQLVEFFNSSIKHQLIDLESYTYDFTFVGHTMTPYFIEPNGFGANYSAGSALFHWVNDHDTLHDASSIELRYVDR
jgi:hypothetical protein